MSELSSEMAALADRLGPPGDRGRVVQFVAPDGESDASAVARAFALEMSRSAAKGVWLIELDILKSAQHRYFEERQDIYGALGPPARAAPGNDLYFTVHPAAPGQTRDGDFVYAQSVGRSRLWITRFRREALGLGQTVKILADGAYYEALRPHADYVVVDSPPLQRSSAAKAAAPFVDDTVIVVSAATPDPLAVRRLKDDLREAGGRCAGLVLTDAPKEPPAFLRPLMGRR